MGELDTPEEVADFYRGRISAAYIRKLVQERKVACTRGARRKVMFTPTQREALLKYLEEQPAESTGPGAFKSTARSAARRRGAK